MLKNNHFFWLCQDSNPGLLNDQGAGKIQSLILVNSISVSFCTKHFLNLLFLDSFFDLFPYICRFFWIILFLANFSQQVFPSLFVWLSTQKQYQIFIKSRFFSLPIYNQTLPILSKNEMMKIWWHEKWGQAKMKGVGWLHQRGF